VDKLIEGVILTPLKQIIHPKGDIYHDMKRSDSGFFGFGEAYFSTVVNGEVKGWKKHTKMVLNLIVPVGEIEFVVFDDRAASSTFKQFFSCKLGQSNYQRLTVPVGVWLSFRGLGEGVSILLNIASIEHDPTESLSTELKNIKYEW